MTTIAVRKQSAHHPDGFVFSERDSDTVITHVVAAWPPLTRRQRERLAALIASAADSR